MDQGLVEQTKRHHNFPCQSIESKNQLVD